MAPTKANNKRKTQRSMSKQEYVVWQRQLMQQQQYQINKLQEEILGQKRHLLTSMCSNEENLMAASAIMNADAVKQPYPAVMDSMVVSNGQGLLPRPSFDATQNSKEVEAAAASNCLNVAGKYEHLCRADRALKAAHEQIASTLRGDSSSSCPPSQVSQPMHNPPLKTQPQVLSEDLRSMMVASRTTDSAVTAEAPGANGTLLPSIANYLRIVASTANDAQQQPVSVNDPSLALGRNIRTHQLPPDVWIDAAGNAHRFERRELPTKERMSSQQQLLPLQKTSAPEGDAINEQQMTGNFNLPVEKDVRTRLLWLTSTGVDWTMTGSWSSLRDRVLDFRKQHGHAIIPNEEDYISNPGIVPHDPNLVELCRWASAVRNLYTDIKYAILRNAERRRVRRCKLLDAEFEKLEKLGFVWEITGWYVYYLQLVHHFKIRGHTDVAVRRGSKRDQDLLDWSVYQRLAYKSTILASHNKDNKTKSPPRIRVITPNQIQLLDAICFDWDKALPDSFRGKYLFEEEWMEHLNGLEIAVVEDDSRVKDAVRDTLAPQTAQPSSKVRRAWDKYLEENRDPPKLPCATLDVCCGMVESEISEPQGDDVAEELFWKRAAERGYVKLDDGTFDSPEDNHGDDNDVDDDKKVGINIHDEAGDDTHDENATEEMAFWNQHHRRLSSQQGLLPAPTQADPGEETNLVARASKRSENGTIGVASGPTDALRGDLGAKHDVRLTAVGQDEDCKDTGDNKRCHEQLNSASGWDRSASNAEPCAKRLAREMLVAAAGHRSSSMGRAHW